MPYIVLPSVEPRYTPLFEPVRETQIAGRPLVDPSRKDGTMLDPERVPKWGRRVSRGTEMPDLFPMVAAWCISERFKDLIEQHEPGVHGFYYVPLFQKDGSAIVTRFFLLDVRQVVDAVVPEASDGLRLTRLDDGRTILHFNDYSKVAVSSSKVAGRHVWRGREHLSDKIFMSDVLVAALQRARIRKPQYYRTLDVA